MIGEAGLVNARYEVGFLMNEIDTVLVLSGVTAKEDLKKFASRPRYTLPTVGNIPDLGKE